MKVLKVEFILEKKDKSDIEQEFANMISDDFIGFAESHGLDWHGHFTIIEKEQKPRMDIPGGKVVVHLDRGLDVHVIFCADTEEEAIKNMLAGGYVEEEITGIYEADPIGEIPGYFLVNRWRSR